MDEFLDRAAAQAAHVLYHPAVPLREQGFGLADAERVIDGRRQR